MAVVGIDLGNLNIVIAQAQRGGVDVVLNESSNRQNPNIVSIADKQRFVGEQALPMARSNYQNTIYGNKRLIGRKFDDPEIQSEIASLPFKVVQLNNGGIGYEVTYNGEPTILSPEQITSMLFGKVNSIIQNNTGVNIAEAVIGIPGWFTDAQRRAVLDAADIVNLNVLCLMHEGTAVALSYGIYKSVRNMFHESEPQHVLFLDLGHSNFSASVVDFIQGKLIVRSAVYDRELGGREFDNKIVDFLAEKFIEKYKKDPRKNIKARLKLEGAAERAKKTLSPAGVQEASVSIECLMDEIDLNCKLPLADFEARCAPLLDRIEAPIKQALAEAGVTPEQLANVEIVGGGTRVSSFKIRLADILGLDKSRLNYGLSTTLNADEAVSRGCALQAAILSSRFQVKPFEVIDACPYPIRVSWDQTGSSKDAMETDTAAEKEEETEAQIDEASGDTSLIIFKRNDRIPNQRRITFKKNADFTIAVTYDDSALAFLPGGSNSEIATFQICVPKEHQGVGKAPKIRLTLLYNLHGVLVMTQAQLMEEIVPAPIKSEEMKETEKVEGNGVIPPNDAKKEEKKEEKKDPMQPKKKYKTHSLKVITTACGLSKTEKDAFVELEARMEQQDRIIKETADMRNALESYIYSAKDRLAGSWRSYTTEKDATAFNSGLEETETWLYDDGFDSTKTIYAKKLGDLRAKGDPMEKRLEETQRREPTKGEFLRQLEDFKELVKSSDEKYAHISDQERDKARAEIKKAESWLYDQLAAQAELPLHKDPILTVQSIKEKQNALAQAIHPIMNRPKPKPEPKPEEKAPPANGGDSEKDKQPAPKSAATGQQEADQQEQASTAPMDTTG